MTEAQIRALIKRHLANYVILDFSDKRRMPSGLKDGPDLIVFLHNITLVIECKKPGSKRSPGQLEWWLKLYPFLGPNLVYICAESLLEVQDEIAHLQPRT